jgi:hypothetical protein
VVWEEEHRKQPLFKHLTPVYTLIMGFSSYVFPVCSLLFFMNSHSIRKKQKEKVGVDGRLKPLKQQLFGGTV